MSDYTEDVFDEKKMKWAIKRGKRKSIIMIVFVSLMVFIFLNIFNFAFSTYFSQKAFKQWDAYVRLSTPNGYISETFDSRGLLGGISHYKVSKDMKNKSVVIEQKQYQFGLSLSVLLSRYSGGNIGVTGEDWQVTYKENGWRELMFFHPEVTYKKYKNDEKLLASAEDDKIFEAALSFDKPYKLNELPLTILPEMTWFWINTYSDSQLNTYRQEAKENDWSSTFIRENEALGFSVNAPVTPTADLGNEYDEFLKLLQTSSFSEHKNTYDMMKNKNVHDLEILGVVIYGTKDEMLEFIKDPAIKAVSLGGIVDRY